MEKIQRTKERWKNTFESIFSNTVQPWLIDCQGFFRDRFKFLACHSCFFQRQFYSLLHLFILGDTFSAAFIFHIPEGDEILQAVGLFHVTVYFFLQECYYRLNNLIPMKAFRDTFEHSKNRLEVSCIFQQDTVNSLFPLAMCYQQD